MKFCFLGICDIGVKDRIKDRMFEDQRKLSSSEEWILCWGPYEGTCTDY